MNSALNDIIPQDWSLWSKTRPNVIRQLSGGLTNRNYLLASSDSHLVLRMNSEFSEALDLNRRAEAAVLQLADKAGLCAPVIHCDSSYQYLVTHYIEGDPWRSEPLGSMKKLAELLRGIHALPAINTRLVVEEKIEKYWQSIDPKAEFYSILHSLDQAIRVHIQKAKALSKGESLCHNDLSAGNLILTTRGELFALDWEYAAVGDPFYELAVIIEEHSLSENQSVVLLTEYLGRKVGPEDQERLDHWRFIYGYLSVLWFAVQCGSGSLGSRHHQHIVLQRARELRNRPS